MRIEKLDDLRSLDLAPPVIVAVAGEVLGVEIEVSEDWDRDELFVTCALANVRRAVSSGALAYFEETRQRREDGYSQLDFERQCAIWESCEEEMVDRSNLAIDRLRNESNHETESEAAVATKTAKAKSARRATAGTAATIVAPPDAIEERVRAEQRRAKEAGEPVCRVCGCSEAAGCKVPGGCSWVIDVDDNSETDLCSACVGRGGPHGAPIAGRRCNRCRAICTAADVDEIDCCPNCFGQDLSPLTAPGSLAPFAEAAADQIRSHGDPPPRGPVQEIPLGLIDPSPYQPRQDFGEEELAELAASIVRYGVRQPVLVRPRIGDRYELVFGERRLRAAKSIGLQTIPAEVQSLTNAEAADLCCEENVRRKPLNEIEEARQIEIFSGLGYTQEQIAERMPFRDGDRPSQSWISNRRRLLDLPEEWQRRVMTQVISATHARVLYRWLDRPQVLANVAKRLEAAKLHVSVMEFEELVADAALDVSRSLTSYDCKFDATDEAVREKLDLVTVDLPWGGSETRAFNAKLFDKLNNAAKREAAKKAEARQAKAAAKATASPGKSKASKTIYDPPTAFVVQNCVRPWLLGEVRERIDRHDAALCQQVLLALQTGLAHDAGWLPDGETLGRLLSVSLKERTLWTWSDDQKRAAWHALRSFRGAKLDRLLVDLTLAALTPDRHRDLDIDFGWLLGLFVELGGDPRSYPLAADDLVSYPDEMLREMPGGDEVPAKAARETLIASVVKQCAIEHWLPEEFASVLTPPEPPAAKKSPAKKRTTKTASPKRKAKTCQA